MRKKKADTVETGTLGDPGDNHDSQASVQGLGADTRKLGQTSKNTLDKSKRMKERGVN